MILSGYRIMWMFTFFDLPVKTKQQRRLATQFRTSLLDLGFTMVQYSVYARPCNRESDIRIIKQIEFELPPKGKVNIFSITDKQYAAMMVYRNLNQELVEIPEQFTLF